MLTRDMLTISIYCQAVLFDMDGVLIDSTPAVTRVWTQWALEHGFDPADVVASAHGRPSLSTVREYLPHSDSEKENAEVERREMADLDGVVLLPGARELLAALPRDRWTIVTSSTRRLAEVRLRAAGLPIPKAFITATDIVHGKPDPEPYSKAAQLLNLPANGCLVIEDVPAGIRSGKDAGARVIGLTTTISSEALAQAGSDWIAENCSAIAVNDFSSHEIQLTVHTIDPRTPR